MSFNLATILQETAAATPDARVCVTRGNAMTYRELDELSGRFAAGLGEHGLAPGQVVALQLPNVPHFLIAYFGALKAGMVVLPLNPLLKAPEIEYHLADSSARLLIGLNGMHIDAARACAALDVPLYLVRLDDAALPGGAADAMGLISGAPLAGPGGEVRPGHADDTAVLIYTSGTTGKPKGAELTHFQLYMNCTIAGQLFGALPDDVTLAVLPFFHVFGLSSVINVSVRYGGCLSIVPRFEIKAVLDALEGDRCTVIAGVPTMLHALAEQDVAGRRPVRAARRGLRRRLAARGRHARFRGQVRHRRAGGLRPVRDRQHQLVQPAGRPAAAVHRQADLGRADARRGRR